MFKDELQNLGLSEKEARVYLASLELGPESVLRITQKAGINRPTCYVQIESLITKGLMSSFQKGKKKYFSAEAPDRLLSLISKHQKELEDKESVLKTILPGLEEIFSLSGEKPKVRFYEGKEGLKAIQQDFLKTKEKKIQVVFNIDYIEKVFTPDERKEYFSKRYKKRIKADAIYTSSGGTTIPEKEEFGENYYVDSEKFPITSDITIYGDKVAIVSLKGKLVGVIIENWEIAQTLKSVFYLAWETLRNRVKN